MDKELNDTNNKEQLQIEKLKLEVNSLKRTWWKNPTYIGIFIPAFLTLISLVYAISTGFFDKKYERYRVEKASLKLEILKFEDEKKSILYQRDSALTLVNNLKVEMEILRAQINNTAIANDLEIDYGTSGQILSIKGGDKLSTKFQYDNTSSRLTKATLPNGKIVNFKYNAKGEIINK